MDESISRKGRGRPRKNPLTTTGDNAFDNKNDIEQAIDETKFDFFNPTEATPEVGVFNPLSESTVERDYSTPPIQDGYVPDLEEPSFHQKTFNEIQADRGQAPQQPQGGSPQEQQFRPQPQQDPLMNPNPALNELDDRERRIASEQMVDAVLDTYETLSTMSGNLARMDEQKVREMISSGKIDPNRRIPVDEHGNTVSVMEFVQGYNAQVGTAVENDPAFRKKVRPAMVRVFSKRGWGMTDEQFLLFAFGKDISIKAVTLYGMKKGVNDILKRLQEEAKGKSSPRPTPPPPAPTPSPTYQEPTDDVETPEVEEISDGDIAYYERMQEALAQRAEMERIQKEEEERQSRGVQKFNIDDDNPLREKIVREYPAPHVEETFIKGGEIVDNPSTTGDVPPSQPSDTNETE